MNFRLSFGLWNTEQTIQWLVDETPTECIEALTYFKRFENAKSLRRFLRMINFCRRFFQILQLIRQYYMEQYHLKVKKYSWTQELDHAFQSCKNCILKDLESPSHMFLRNNTKTSIIQLFKGPFRALVKKALLLTE